MIRINLLPHREMRRELRKREFLGNLAATAIVAIVLVVAGGMVINRQIEHQAGRNSYVQGAVNKLDTEIAEIKNLEESIASLRARQEAVEDLQSDRTIPVHLLDELVKVMPDGVFLLKLQQLDLTVTLNGFAQSNERVAELLRNLSDRSQWLEKPQLDEIKEVAVSGAGLPVAAGVVDGRKAYEFKLNVLMKRRSPGNGQGAAAAKAAANASTGTPDLLSAAGGKQRGGER